MKPHQLRSFIAIADSGTLASAAKWLHKTPPAVSKALRELEEEFGTPLFDRRSKGMTLTRAGGKLLPRARLILEEMRKVAEEMGEVQGETEKLLRIGTTPQGSFLCSRAVANFRRKMPTVRIEFYEYSAFHLLDLLDDGRIDVLLCGFVSDFPPLTSVECNHLFSVPMCISTRAGGMYCRANSLADLRDAHWMYIDPTGGQERYVANRFIEQGLAPPRNSILCTASLVALALTRESDVVTLISRDIFEQYACDLIELRLLDDLPHIEMQSVTRIDSIPTDAARVFLECVTEGSDFYLSSEKLLVAAGV